MKDLRDVHRDALWGQTLASFCPDSNLRALASRSQLPSTDRFRSWSEPQASQAGLGKVDWGNSDSFQATNSKSFRHLANGNASFHFTKSAQGPGVNWIAFRR
ncbi:MAG TPA: hypothetical protein EYO33_20125 [Phycisphaerales bacterium]|nr:hypothetical protein [Phycisphaerales bacterium]